MPADLFRYEKQVLDRVTQVCYYYATIEHGRALLPGRCKAIVNQFVAVEPGRR
jgi:hypothetical protein